MKITNIQWETDGNKDALADLPTELELPADGEFNPGNFEDEEDLLDYLSDYLSDQYGFLHDGFCLEDSPYDKSLMLTHIGFASVIAEI